MVTNLANTTGLRPSSVLNTPPTLSRSPVARLWGRVATCAATVPATLSFFVPRVAHFWLIRLVLALPGLDPAVEDVLRRYVAGLPVSGVAPHAHDAARSHSAATSTGSFKAVCFRARTPLAETAALPATSSLKRDTSTTFFDTLSPSISVSDPPGLSRLPLMQRTVEDGAHFADQLEWNFTWGSSQTTSQTISSRLGNSATRLICEQNQHSTSVAQTTSPTIDYDSIRTPFGVWIDTHAGSNGDCLTLLADDVHHDTRQRSLSPPELSSSDEELENTSCGSGGSDALGTYDSDKENVGIYQGQSWKNTADQDLASHVPDVFSQGQEDDAIPGSLSRPYAPVPAASFWSRDAKAEPEQPLYHDVDQRTNHQQYQQTDPAPNQPSCICLRHNNEQYWVYHKLGEGAYGRVFIAWHQNSGQRVAIKAVRKRTLYSHPRGRKMILEELAAWQRVTQGVPGKGPSGGRGLVRLLEAFDDDQNVYFITKLYYETLEQRMRTGEPFHLKEIQLYTAELVNSVNSLHEFDIMHRDIKPSNILIAPDGHLAITDFGLSHASPLHRGRPFHKRTSGEQAGTAGYWAPEVRTYREGHSGGTQASSDLYSLGVVVLEMALNERTPFFRGQTPEAVNHDMATRQIPWERLERLDRGLCDLLQRMLAENPRDRWTAAALMDHPYFADLHFPSVENGKYTPTYFPRDPEPATNTVFDVSYFQDSLSKDQDTSELGPWIREQLWQDQETMIYEYVCPKKYLNLAWTGCVSTQAERRSDRAPGDDMQGSEPMLDAFPIA